MLKYPTDLWHTFVIIAEKAFSMVKQGPTTEVWLVLSGKKEHKELEKCLGQICTLPVLRLMGRELG